MSDAIINGVSGAGGGIIAQLITYPLQTVNTRQQTDRDLSNLNSGIKHGTIAQMCQVVKQEGWARLYGGLTPSLVGTAASQGVYYYFYQIFRDRAELASLARQRKGIGDGSLGMLQSLVVASLAGSVNVLLTNPMWVIVTRMQTFKKKKNPQEKHLLPSVSNDDQSVAAESSRYGIFDVIKELYAEAGLFGLWKGVFPTLIMVCNPAIQFMLYEAMVKKRKKKQSSNTKGAEGLTAVEIFLFGAIAKLGATIVTYPLLVVKSRLQAKQGLHLDRQHHYRGCGSGLSGETLSANEHHWIGFDISPSMLDVALEREVEGDLLLADMGQGLGLRSGVIDGAISISAIQWLCYADKSSHEPIARLKAFFVSLYRCLARGARAVLQLYSENASQSEMIMKAAMRAGFAGGVVVDFPHSTKARKAYLVLTCGPSSMQTSLPKGKGEDGEMCSDDDEDESGDDDDGKQTVGVYDRHRPTKRQKITKKGKGKAWVLKKKNQMRNKGYNVPPDTKYTARKRKGHF